MNKKYEKVLSTRNSLLMSIISLILCFAMLIGTTYAWFTDEVTSGTNKIIAGNLDIEVTHKNAKVTTAESIKNVTTMFPDKNGGAMLWEPGAVSYETITVSNVGNLALKYNISMNVTAYNKVQGTNDNLKDAIKVMVLTGSNMLENVTRETVLGMNWENAQTLEDFRKNDGVLYPVGTTSGEAVLASEETFQLIAYWQPTDNDNKWNLNNGKHNTDGYKIGDEEALFIDFGINVVATQLQHESDSFDNTYDGDATLPPLPERLNGSGASDPSTRSKTGDNTTILDTDMQIQIKRSVSETQTQQVVGNAEVPAAAANKLLDTYFTALENVTPDANTTVEDKLVLTLNVETKEALPASIKVDVTMFANATRTTTVAGSDPVVDTKANESVTELEAPVKVVLNLDPGLENVSVTHTHNSSSEALTPVEDLNNVTDGNFYYDKTTGKLTLATSKFSEFDITFTRPAAYRIGNTPYGTLADVLEAARSGDTVVLLDDISIAENDITVKNGVIVDANGHKITRDGVEIKNFVGNLTALKYFAGGSGTNTDPYKLGTESDFANINEVSVKGKNYAYKFENDITYTRDDSINYLNGVIDGDGHDLTLTGDTTFLFAHGASGGELKNLDIIQANPDHKFSGIVYRNGWDANDNTILIGYLTKLTNINVYPKDENAIYYSSMGYRAGVFIHQPSTNLKLVNCNNYMNVCDDTQASVGIFIGNYVYPISDYGFTVVMDNCWNYGNVTGNDVGVLIGNSNNKNIQLTDSTTVTQYNVNGLVKLYVNNCGNNGVIAAGTGCFPINTIPAGNQNTQKWIDLNAQLINTGKFTTGEMNVGNIKLTATSADGKTISITPNDSVDKYDVIMRVATGYSDGSEYAVIRQTVSKSDLAFAEIKLVSRFLRESAYTEETSNTYASITSEELTDTLGHRYKLTEIDEKYVAVFTDEALASTRSEGAEVTYFGTTPEILVNALDSHGTFLGTEQYSVDELIHSVG